MKFVWTKNAIVEILERCVGNVLARFGPEQTARPLDAALIAFRVFVRLASDALQKFGWRQQRHWGALQFADPPMSTAREYVFPLLNNQRIPH